MVTTDAAALTLGVEEEFHILDARTGRLAPRAPGLLRAVPGDEAEAELQRSMIETSSGIHDDLASLRADLVARRRVLRDSAQPLGLVVAASGTVGGSGDGSSRLSPDPRYEWMAHEYRQLVAEQQLCACQVHVGIADRNLAVRVTQRIRRWLPVLLALSASSPLFQDGDTGYASYRAIAVSRWPTVGPPPDFADADEYDGTVAALVQSGVISDAKMIYFDARLSARYPTIEIRVTDGCPLVDDVVLLAALGRALAATAIAEDAAGVPILPARQVILRAATWRAARSGLTGLLLHPRTDLAVPAADAVSALLGYVREALESRGEWDTVTDLSRALLSRGTSAQRQRAALHRGVPVETIALDVAVETAGD